MPSSDWGEELYYVITYQPAGGYKSQVNVSLQEVSVNRGRCSHTLLLKHHRHHHIQVSLANQAGRGPFSPVLIAMPQIAAPPDSIDTPAPSFDTTDPSSSLNHPIKTLVVDNAGVKSPGLKGDVVPGLGLKSTGENVTAMIEQKYFIRF